MSSGSYHPAPVRPPSDDIAAPAFPKGARWIGCAPLRMDQQAGRPVLLEFFDVCRPSSMRTLPYLQAWHERYAPDGLRVISVHTPGYAEGRDEDAVAARVERLGIAHPVLLDTQGVLWTDYGNQGWPGRYLWNGESRLAEYHYGEGGYAATEQAIQELLGLERDVLAPLRPEDDPESLLVVPSDDHDGAWSGDYAAGGVWGAFAGAGTITVNGEDVVIEGPCAIPLAEHPVHTEAHLDLHVGPGVTCLGVHFTPGLAP